MPCSIFGLELDPLFYNADVLFLETGWIGNTKETRASSHPKATIQDHISFEENIGLVETLRPKKAILTHIEGTQHMTTAKLEKLLKPFKKKNVFAAKEGMRFNL